LLKRKGICLGKTLSPQRKSRYCLLVVIAEDLNEKYSSESCVPFKLYLSRLYTRSPIGVYGNMRKICGKKKKARSQNPE
jgi:hypothetical protein